MKAITFLGVRPLDALYTMDGKEWEAKQFGVALARFRPNLKLRALVTEKALAEQYPQFEHDVEDFVADVRAVPIPDGRDPDDLWQLFDCVIDQIEENEEVIFDITHGFRSLPFLAFLAAAYVRIVKGAQIQGVYYANFDARFGDPARVPVVDLTEFVTLFDWMIAADLFARRGDSTRLADLMRPDLRSATPDERERRRSSIAVQSTTTMATLSQNLRLIRPDEVMKASAKLVGLLDGGAGAFAQTARPFVPLVEQVAGAYRPLALAEPGKNPVDALAIERELVHWYLDRGYLVQAVAVAREWLVSWTLLQAGHSDVLNKNERKAAEWGITALSKHPENEEPKSAQIDLSAVPEIDKVSQLYSQLGDLRNDLLHAGKRKSPSSAATLEKNIKRFCADLYELPVIQETPSGTQ